MVVAVYCANITWLANDPTPNIKREGFFGISFALPFSFEDFSGEPTKPIHTADVDNNCCAYSPIVAYGITAHKTIASKNKHNVLKGASTSEQAKPCSKPCITSSQAVQAVQLWNSVRFRRVMQPILSLGNGLKHGAAVGFKLDTLLKLNDTHSRKKTMTLMHYLSLETKVDGEGPTILQLLWDRFCDNNIKLISSVARIATATVRLGFPERKLRIIPGDRESPADGMLNTEKCTRLSSHANSKIWASEPINQVGVSELLKSVDEPLRKVLESVPVELANKTSSSASVLAEKMKAVYLSQMHASMASLNVSKTEAGEGSKGTNKNTADGVEKKMDEISN
ncbi:hypothetical protein CTI12_AA438300 [Artemisia annua]|uniref:FH2 domain-containing protein n=1 Tax=Artemisia annua TaxID=35608 RepID=A0A2U1LZD9_ARTAN|nr:hypothetical protein CTI12_AA438300 [Artemisia annua]